MRSLYDELAAKLAQDPSLMKRGGPRYDLGLLLFDYRDELRALWAAGERELAVSGAEETGGSARGSLADAVEALRPLFGER